MENCLNNKKCINCGVDFTLSNKTLDIILKTSPILGGQKYTFSNPKLCSNCRKQRRLAFRNERKLYRRNCDATGNPIISIYSEDKPFKVYDAKIRWSDRYDPTSYGKDYDFNKPFFKQLKELLNKVPLPAIQNTKSENCDYTNYSSENKNCYMSIGCLKSEDIYHSYRVFNSKDILDSFDIQTSQGCYECLESSNLYDCSYCRNCHDSSNCFACINLKNKEYCILNKQYTKQEYHEYINDYKNKNILKLYHKLAQGTKIDNEQIACDNSTGGNLLNCKNCTNCFTLKYSRDCNNCLVGENNEDCGDSNFFDNCKAQYESTNLEANYKCAFSNLVRYTSDSYYTMITFNSKHCFGCVGLKGQEYCILNKQYTKQEYQEILPKIIKHMKETGEYGEYFPIDLSPFDYNETIAQEYFPLLEQDAEDKGYGWKTQEDKDYDGKKYTPISIGQYKNIEQQNELLNAIIRCKLTGRPFRIVKPELMFYLKHDIEIPTIHPDLRHQNRMNQRSIFK